jgi:uroporphyrinogen decarboxylase
MSSRVVNDQMTPKERLEAVLHGKPYDRIPCSLNVGAHAAKLLGLKTSEFGRSADKQVEGILASYKEYGVEFLGPHANILSSLGLKYVIPENSTPYVAEPLINDYSDLDRLEIPDFRKAKELQVFWETLDRVTEEIGDEVPISIGLSGPFSAAAHLRGIEKFLRDLYQSPEFAHQLLGFVRDATASFVREVGKYGVRFGIFNPTASGSLISPVQYRKFSFPYEKDLISVMREVGDDAPMLHICGNTTKIWKDMADTGAGILSLDNIIDLGEAKRQVGDRVVLMGNVKPTDTMLFGTPADVEENVLECITKAADSPKGYLMALGCGLPLNTPSENIHALVAATRKYGQRLVNTN